MDDWFRRQGGLVAMGLLAAVPGCNDPDPGKDTTTANTTSADPGSNGDGGGTSTANGTTGDTPTGSGTGVTTTGDTTTGVTTTGDTTTGVTTTGAESSGSESSGSESPIDMAPYWARAGGLQTYRKWNGDLFGRYRFTEDQSESFLPLYQQFYDQGHPGTLVSWQKEYPVGDAFCTATYGLLWFGDDGSIMEVGDWLAFPGCMTYGAFGYRRLGQIENSGLIWSPAGGLGGGLVPELEVDVFSQNTPGGAYVDNGYDAYSTVVMLDHEPTWTAPHGDEGQPGQWSAGAGTTYTDVVHLVFYHGTRSPQIKQGLDSPARCGPDSLDPDWPRSQLYRSYADYESYAVELRLARDVGIVSEALLFTESDYWGAQFVCAGAVMGLDHEAAEQAWTWYLD